MDTAVISSGDSRREIRFGRGLEVHVDFDVLASFGSRPLTTLEVDLLRLAGAVAFADRTHRRSPAIGGWARTLHLQMPVDDPDRWKGAAPSLTECLTYVSGDRWSFEFMRGLRCAHQPSFPNNVEYTTIVPFSGGMDSFLLKQDLLRQNERLLLVTTRTGASVLAAARNAAGSTAHLAGLPVRLKPGPRPEATYRTRTFMFGVAAAIAATICGSTRVDIAESGQGSIGASLLPFGDEVPYRTTHPVFTANLKHFLSLFDVHVQFRHPYMWRTKGSVLSELNAHGAATGWQETSSCSRNIARAKGTHDTRACGICGNCLLRRVAVHAAALSETAQYHWELHQDSLEEAEVSGGRTGTTKADIGIAARGVIGMQSFASMRPDAPELRRNAHAIATRLRTPIHEVMQHQNELQMAHRNEWNSFLSTLPSTSWVHRYAKDADVFCS